MGLGRLLHPSHPPFSKLTWKACFSSYLWLPTLSKCSPKKKKEGNKERGKGRTEEWKKGSEEKAKVNIAPRNP